MQVSIEIKGYFSL